MLQPGRRLTLIDAMRPPAGYRFDAAMAVTFTLDLRALLAAPAAFALSHVDAAGAGDQQAEPIELLHAVRSYAGNMTVFSQAGEIALPPPRRVFAFLERVVVPVTAPRGGLVHPKVWVLRYQPVDGSSVSRLRVLTASRNLTFDTSWDIVLRLDESDGGRGCHLGPVADLFEGLAKRAVTSPLAPDHGERIASLCADLRLASFAYPPGVDDLRFHVLGLGDAACPLPGEADRALIISPFVSDDFFTRIRPAKVDELVSRAESLDQLRPAAKASIGALYSFDDGSTPDLAAREDLLSAADPGRPLRGLHAKVFAFETGRQARLFCGSANATGAAFARNIEVLVELVGSTSELGIDRLCDGNADENGLRALFHTYVGTEDPPGPEPGGEVDTIRRRLATIALEGSVEESVERWAVTYRSKAVVKAPPGITIACWPLPTPGHRQAVTPGERLEARFETTVESISGFLAFEVAHPATATVTQFVVPVKLSGLPAYRDRQLMKALIGNAGRFLRYLLALLDDDQTGTDLVDSIEHAATDQGEGPTGGLSLPVLEKLLRTMRRDPAKLAAVHPLVRDLAADDALPPGFADLWATVYRVALEGEGES